MNDYNNLSWNDIKAMFAETDRQMAETDRKLDKMIAENERRAAENERRTAERAKEIKRETAKAKRETDKIEQETLQIKREAAKIAAETDRRIAKLERLVGGISNNNGEMAEDYFYSAFRANKTFANEKFDKVRRNLAYKKEDVEAEFDLVLFNGKCAALIEVKYNAKPDNISVEEIISRVKIFKMLYPEYENHKIYLGVAAMSFRKGLEERLHRAGIATVRQIGRKMVRFDKDVKAF